MPTQTRLHITENQFWYTYFSPPPPFLKLNQWKVFKKAWNFYFYFLHQQVDSQAVTWKCDVSDHSVQCDLKNLRKLDKVEVERWAYCFPDWQLCTCSVLNDCGCILCLIVLSAMVVNWLTGLVFAQCTILCARLLRSYLPEVCCMSFRLHSCVSVRSLKHSQTLTCSIWTSWLLQK